MRSHRGRLLVTLSLLALTACSSASARRVAGGPASTTTAPGGAPGDGAGAGGGTPTPAAAPTTAPTRGTAQGTGQAPPPSGAAAPATTTRTALPTSAPARPPAAFDAARGPVGGFARVLLQPQPARRIVVEVLAQSGAAPRSATVQHVTGSLHDASGGKDTSARSGSVAGAARSWSADDIASAADSATGVQQGADGTAVVRLLYLHGDYGGDGSVLGVAVRGDVLAVFVDQLKASASVAVPEPVLEDAVSMHELGHVLGLVDLVLHTGRQDPEHPGHSTNRGSVMYWAVDTDLVSQLLDGAPSTEFDDVDRRDLATIHNGG